MKNKKLLSIITTCFNSDKTIRKTLSSVLEIKNADIEYIMGLKTHN